MSKKVVVLGAGGFIGGHLVSRLKKEGYWVRGVDIKWHEYKETEADEFIVADLRNPIKVDTVIDETIDEVYQLAADMGGAEFVFTGLNDCDIMHNSVLINLNVCDVCVKKGVKKVFYSSSACAYPEHNQLDPNNPNCEESSAYPANPDSEYGWEKLFSERMCRHFLEDYGLDVKVARYHNIFGPNGTYDGGREKAPAALCRKIINSIINNSNSIDVWGDGKQTRSFLYIADCIEATLKLFDSEHHGPINIGSEEKVSINEMIDKIEKIADKKVKRNYQLDKPKGVRGRNSDNTLIRDQLNWEPKFSLYQGLEKTYKWIFTEINKKHNQ